MCRKFKNIIAELKEKTVWMNVLKICKIPTNSKLVFRRQCLQ